MSSTFMHRAVFLAALTLSSAIQAAPATLSAGQVNIDYDTDGFYFTRDDAFGGQEVPASSVGIQAVTNGVELDFNYLMSIYASSYTNFSPQSLSGSFNALFNFTPTAGHVITGYTLTYVGDYSTESPASVYLGDSAGAAFSQTSGSGLFTAIATFAGSTAPAIQGSLGATGDAITIQVYDGTESYLDHYETVLDYCEVDDPSICYYREDPVFTYLPIYHDETDLGEASINLQRVSLIANVAAVPEPEGLALLFMGLPLAAWLARRRRVTTAALLLVCATAAQADPIQYATGQVTIDFDPTAFTFISDTIYSGQQGVSPAYSQVGQGVVLDFGGTLSAYASSYQYFSPDARTASFNALFNFTPEAGYLITGYTVTYTGGYFVELPGSVSLNAQSGTLILNSNGGGDSFSIDNYQSGSAAPLLAGELSASANVEYIQIFDGYEQVYSHDEQVLDYCETEDPFTCYYHSEPVYSDQPVYHTESDLGEGQIFLSTISVQAHVAAVPEPESLALCLAGGLAVAGSRWRARRQA